MTCFLPPSSDTNGKLSLSDVLPLVKREFSFYRPERGIMGHSANAE